MWGRPGGLHSSQFLDGPIHEKVYQKYYNLDMLNNMEVEIYKKKAQRLQEILYDLKNYKNPQNTNHIFKESEYNLFLQTFGEVTNSNGVPLSNDYLGLQIGNTARGKIFEKELVNLQKTLILSIKKAAEKIDANINIQSSSPISIQIGGKNTAINFPDIVGPLNEIILHDICGIQSYRVIKQDRQTTKHYVVEEVNPKIDVINVNSLEVSAEIKMEYPTLAQFAQLYLQSSITAKNYKDTSIKKFGVSLGNTNIFRIMADFIPTLNIIQNREQEISFQYALFKRYGGLVGQTIDADWRIPEHFYHIQNIYELMGVGQSIADPDLKQLQSYINQGAELLILNVHNTNNIYVRSTRDILRQKYNRGELTNLSAIGEKITLDSSYFH